jgi:hypothetical protein
MGWEPARHITFEADPAGRIVGAQVETEPEWDPTERAWMIALAQFHDQLCPKCGFPTRICHDPSIEWRTSAEPERCHIATAVARAQEQAQKENRPYTQALNWKLKIRPEEGGD